MNLTPQQLAALISKAVEAAKGNPAPVVQGIKRRLLRELAEEIAELAYPDTLKWPRSIRRNAELREEFLTACRIEELKEG